VPRLSHLIAALAVLAGLAFALAQPFGLEAQAARGAGLVIATIGLLATGALPEYVTAILFFAVAMLVAVAPAATVFSGFHSTAFWLVFGGLVIGLGVRRTGLADRMARAIGERLGGSYPMLIGGCVALGVGFAFLMPSTLGRTLVLLPVVIAMSEAFGFAPGSRGRQGIVLATSFATMIPGFAILPATVPGILLAGMSETLYREPIVYGRYLLLHFPVLGFLKALVIWALVVRMFPDSIPQPIAAAEKKPMQRDEKGMALLLVLALALWVTDFLHHVSPAWVALGVGAVCLLPFVGLVPAQAFNERMNFGSLFYVAGVLGVGALVAYAGLGDLLAKAALDVLHLEPGADGWTFLAVAGLSTLIATAVTQPSVPVIMAPLAQSIADAAGLPVSTVLMMVVVGFSTVILPYQTPPLVVAMQLGQVPMTVGNRLCLALLAVTLAVLLPLDYLWWRLLGAIG